jgi:hypothetical protein
MIRVRISAVNDTNTPVAPSARVGTWYSCDETTSTQFLRVVPLSLAGGAETDVEAFLHF